MLVPSIDHVELGWLWRQLINLEIEKVSIYLGVLTNEDVHIQFVYLTPKETDFGKSLLRFSEESVMNKDAEDWLPLQVATNYGLDKATMSERLAGKVQ